MPIIRPHLVDKDLAELAEFIARTNPDAGLKFLSAAEATFNQLAQMPRMGGPWDSANPRLSDLRVWPVQGFESHLIFYRPRADGICVVRVLHGSRDIERILTK